MRVFAGVLGAALLALAVNNLFDDHLILEENDVYDARFFIGDDNADFLRDLSLDGVGLKKATLSKTIDGDTGYYVLDCGQYCILNLYADFFLVSEWVAALLLIAYGLVGNKKVGVAAAGACVALAVAAVAVLADMSGKLNDSGYTVVAVVEFIILAEVLPLAFVSGLIFYREPTPEVDWIVFVGAFYIALGYVFATTNVFIYEGKTEAVGTSCYGVKDDNFNGRICEDMEGFNTADYDLIVPPFLFVFGVVLMFFKRKYVVSVAAVLVVGITIFMLVDLTSDSYLANYETEIDDDDDEIRKRRHVTIQSPEFGITTIAVEGAVHAVFLIVGPLVAVWYVMRSGEAPFVVL